MVCASGGNYPIRALSIAKKEMGLKNFRMLFAGKGQDEEKLAALYGVISLGRCGTGHLCGLLLIQQIGP